MLDLFGGSQNYCDGMARRDFLRIGGLAFGGFALADILRAEAQAGSAPTGKSIINIFLGGGPTHMDTFDLKPNAPKEYRGEFNPIKTKSDGLEICELMPELATVGDKFSVVRSVDGLRNEHSARQSDSGWNETSLPSLGGRPGIGSVMSKVFGPAQATPHGTAPTHVDLNGWTRPGYLGQMHSAYRPDGTGRANLKLHGNVTTGRLDDRKSLLGGLDRLRRDIDRGGMMTALDSFNQRAVGMITSGEIYNALDLNNEDPRNRSRYPHSSFLTARRLITSGVRSVGISLGGWDTHSQNFNAMRRLLPPLSQSMAALIEDLDAHGQLDDTIIMMSGEFGRTPRINGGAGRDHWPRAGFFFLGGGGMRHGQAIGATNRLGEQPHERPVHLQNIFHTVYHQLGIDTNTTTLIDPNGRPQYLVEKRELIHELV